MTDSHCSLQEILIFSYLPDSYKVRSGPGVSEKIDPIAYPLMKLYIAKVSISIRLATVQARGGALMKLHQNGTVF